MSVIFKAAGRAALIVTLIIIFGYALLIAWVWNDPRSAKDVVNWVEQIPARLHGAGMSRDYTLWVRVLFHPGTWLLLLTTTTTRFVVAIVVALRSASGNVFVRIMIYYLLAVVLANSVIVLMAVTWPGHLEWLLQHALDLKQLVTGNIGLSASQEFWADLVMSEMALLSAGFLIVARVFITLINAAAYRRAWHRARKREAA